MTVSSYTPNFRFGLIDFNSTTWHTDDWANWQLLDALLQTQFDDLPFAVATGTPDALLLDYTPSYTAYVAGMYISFQTSAANTGAVTINVDGLGAKDLKVNGQALTSGDLPSAVIVRAIYTGTYFAILEPLTRTSRVTISAGVSGSTPDADADELIVENSANSGISVLTPNNAIGALYFGDPENNVIGGLEYDHTTNEMFLRSGGRYKLALVNSQGIVGDLAGGTDFIIRETSTNDVVQMGAGASGGVFVNVTNGRVGIGTGTTAPTHGLDVDVAAHFSGAVTLAGGLNTPLVVAQGGTGAADAATARTNLGIGSLGTLNSINNSNWSGADLEIANGGTGASSASAAFTNLAASGGTVGGVLVLGDDVIHNLAGPYPYFMDNTVSESRIFLQAIGADPTSQAFDIVLEY